MRNLSIYDERITVDVLLPYFDSIIQNLVFIAASHAYYKCAIYLQYEIEYSEVTGGGRYLFHCSQ